MSTMTRITGGVAAAALATLTLAGCVTVDNGPASAPSGHRDTPATSASAKPSASPSTGSARHLPQLVDLTPDKGTTYLLANQPGGLLSPGSVVGPWMLQWVVDGEKVTYREIVCTGTAARTATGKLEKSEDGTGQVVRWIDNGKGKADDPWQGNAPTKTSNAEVTETSMRVGLLDPATTDVDKQKSDFVGYCKDAGEDVAGIFKR